MTTTLTSRAPASVLGEIGADRRRALVGVGALFGGVAAVFNATHAAAITTEEGPDADIHALRRLTFGPSEADRRAIAEQGFDAWFAAQLDPDVLDTTDLDEALAPLDALPMTAVELRDAAADEAAAGRLLAAQLKIALLIRHVMSPAQLYERLVEFWSDHLNVPQSSAPLGLLKVVEDREVIRPHALGRFDDLLVASAQSPAMLLYLDNAKSSVGAINENYARELLELHTVGVDGGYAESDVVSVARLLTGWGIDRDFTFRFFPRRHDHGDVEMLGWTRPATGDPLTHGEDFLRHLARHPATATRICTKLAQRFVADTPDPDLVARMTEAYRTNDTAIIPVLRTMTDHPAALAAAGEKFNRPWDHLVSLIRALDGTISIPTTRRDIRRVGQVLGSLGQVPFAWPAPNGYPDVEPAWLNAGSLITRWNLAGDLVAGRVPMVSSGLLDRLATELSGSTATQILDRVTIAVRATSLSDGGRELLQNLTGWPPDHQPSHAEIDRHLPGIVTTLLVSAQAQYR